MSLQARDATMCSTCPSRHRAQGLALVVGEEGERHDTSERRNSHSRFSRNRAWPRQALGARTIRSRRGGEGQSCRRWPWERPQQHRKQEEEVREFKVYTLRAPLKAETSRPSLKLDGDGD